MWQKLKFHYSNIPRVFKNIYFLTGIFFVVWMLFIDDNNLMVQYRRHHELSSLLDKREYYLEQIKLTDKEYQELTTNPETQEKFAREHYRMKRDNEDVFVIVEK